MQAPHKRPRRWRGLVERFLSYSSDPDLNALIRLHKTKRAHFSLTMAGRTDGGGAQVQAAMSVQALCLAMEIPYVHTPFTQLDHAQDPDYPVRWERAFGFSLTNPTQPQERSVSAAEFMQDKTLWNTGMVVRLADAQKYTRHHPELYWPVAQRIRPHFFGQDSISTRPLTCAIHVRRGDVSNDRHKRRFTPVERLFPAVSAVQAAAERAHQDVSFVVHSNGAPDELRPLAELGCMLCTDTDPLDSLRDMALANILVAAKSSFSYVAALLCEGLVVFEPYWNPPLPGWVALKRLHPDHPALVETLSRSRTT